MMTFFFCTSSLKPCNFRGGGEIRRALIRFYFEHSTRRSLKLCAGGFFLKWAIWRGGGSH